MQIIDLEISTEELVNVSSGESVATNKYFNLFAVFPSNFSTLPYTIATHSKGHSLHYLSSV